MKIWKRVISFLLCFILTVGLIGVVELPFVSNRAEASADAGTFTDEDFNTMYLRLLMSLVGQNYPRDNHASEDGRGYQIRTRASTFVSGDSRYPLGTPYNPYDFGTTAYDCSGFVLTPLMAMGYDYFYTSGNPSVHYNIDSITGFNVFGDTYATSSTSSSAAKGLIDYLKNHPSEIVILHHSSNEAYNVKYKIDKVNVNVETLTSIAPGTLIFNYNAQGVMTHYSVGLFAMERTDTMPQNAAYANGNVPASSLGYTSSYANGWDEARATLLTSWNRAYAQLTALGNRYGFDASKVARANQRSLGTSVVPYLWDARGRGFATAVASNTENDDFKRGFRDSNYNGHFATPYSNIWRVEALNSNLGVSVSNNPYGKTTDTLIVSLEPVHYKGEVIITKKDSVTTANLSGATFALYEWSGTSATSGYWVISPNYEIKEQGTSGRYFVYEKGTNRRAQIPLDEATNISTGLGNFGKIRVVETQAPPGHMLGDVTEWTHTFDLNSTNETPVWEFTVNNAPIGVGFQVHKKNDAGAGLSGAVFGLFDNANATGNALQSRTTGSGGDASAFIFGGSSGLALNATYYLKETQAPTGYIADGTVYRIVVGSDGTITIYNHSTGAVVQSISVANARQKTTKFDVNNKYKGSIVVYKSVSPGLNQAKTFYFRVVNSSNVEVGRLSLTVPANSTAQVSGTISNLPDGNYTVQEVTSNTSTTLVSPSEDFPFVAKYYNGTTWVNSASRTVTISSGSQATSQHRNDSINLNVTKDFPNGVKANITVWFWIHADAVGSMPAYNSWHSLSYTTSKTTDSFTLYNLYPRTYTVTEVTGQNSTTEVSTSSSFPYRVTYGTKSQNVSAGQTGNLVVHNNEGYGSLTIKKNIVNLSATELANKTYYFRLIGPSHASPGLLITLNSSNGFSSTINNLTPGNYTIYEKTSADTSAGNAAYNKSTFPYTVNYTDGNTIAVVAGQGKTWNMTQTAHGSFTLRKTVDKTPTQNTTFYFHVVGNSFANGNKVDFVVPLVVPAGQTVKTMELTTVPNDAVLVTTGTKGALLPAGNYTITEVMPNGSAYPNASYNTTNFPYTIASSSNITFSLFGVSQNDPTYNNRESGDLKISKTVLGQHNAGSVTFTVTGKFDGTNTTSRTITINYAAGNGTATYAYTGSDLTGIATGTYTIAETTAPSNSTFTCWLVNSTAFTTPTCNAVVVRGDQTAVSVVAENQAIGSMKLTKKVSWARNEARVFYFLVTGPEYPTGKVFSITVGANQTTASINLNNIKVGTYTLAEIKSDTDRTPVTYNKNTFPYETTGDTSITVVNGSTANPNEAIWKNTEYGDLAIQKNAERITYKYENSKATTTTVDGVVSLSGAKFRVSVGSTAITFDGTTLKYGTVTLNANAVIGEYTTNGEGKILIEKLPAGKYVIEEIDAPDYFVLDTTKTTVTIEKGLTNTTTRNNDEQLIEVSVIKKGVEDEPVEGATIGLVSKTKMDFYQSSYTYPHNSSATSPLTVEIDGVTYYLYDTIVTDTDGKGTFARFWAKYANDLYVVEIEAPTGYNRNPTVFKAHGTTAITNEITKDTVTIVNPNITIMGTKATTTTEDFILQQGIVDNHSTITFMDNVYFSLDPSSSDWRLFIQGFNLAPGTDERQLKVVGKLVDKSTGEFLKQNGDEITAEVTLIPDNVEIITEGTDTYFRFKVEFENIDTSVLRGKTIVMYEYVYAGNQLIAEDTSIDNKAETLYFPTISTVFRNVAPQTDIHGNATDKPGLSGSKTVFVDTVTLTNLIVDQDFELITKIWDETDKKYVDNGLTFTGNTFHTSGTGDTVDTTIEVTITLNTLGLENHSLVCFEYLYAVQGDEKTLVIAEDNPNEEKQTQTVTSKVLPSTGNNDIMYIWMFAFMLIMLGLTLGGILEQRRFEKETQRIAMEEVRNNDD